MRTRVSTEYAAVPWVLWLVWWRRIRPGLSLVSFFFAFLFLFLLCFVFLCCFVFFSLFFSFLGFYFRLFLLFTLYFRFALFFCYFFFLGFLFSFILIVYSISFPSLPSSSLDFSPFHPPLPSFSFLVIPLCFFHLFLFVRFLSVPSTSSILFIFSYSLFFSYSFSFLRRALSQGGAPARVVSISPGAGEECQAVSGEPSRVPRK